MVPKLLLLYLVLVVGLINQVHYGVEGTSNGRRPILNKFPVKTIADEVGDVFDCIDIHKQPALDHPLLKNHKIQMRPSWIPKGYKEKTTASSTDSTRTVIKRLGCPEGTIPIRRTTKEDLIRSKTFFESYTPSSHIHPEAIGVPGLHVAIHKSSTNNRTFHGVYGQINVANPSVGNGQFSAGLIWVDGALDATQFLQAGWAVSPQLFGDNKTRFFVYSNSDANPKGCYNLLCQGFVQVDKDISVGGAIRNISVYAGEQFGITLFRVTGDWWLNYVELNKNVGYWPSNIFSKLQKGASHIAWGGLTKGNPDGPSPQMGNGKFPAKDYEKACSVVHLQVIDESYSLVEPSEFGEYQDFVDNKKWFCYDIEYDGNFGPQQRYSILFGGSGGNYCGE